MAAQSFSICSLSIIPLTTLFFSQERSPYFSRKKHYHDLRSSSALFNMAHRSRIGFAQDSSSSAASISTDTKPSPTTTAVVQTHTISVGNGDHKFRPDVTQAEVGDTIEFTFYPANHSVVRAEYQFPCIPYEMTGSGKTGFFSGFHAVDAVLDSPPSYQLQINDTSPIFFYCSAPGSCTTYGMVGVINPNSSVSLTTQRSLALSSSYMLNPGEPFPAEGSSPSSTPDPNATSSNDKPPLSGSKKLSTGAIAGISVGAISVVVLGALLFFFIGRSRSLNDEMRRNESTIKRTTPPSAFYPHGAQFPHSANLGLGFGGVHTTYSESPNTYNPDSAVDLGTSSNMDRARSHRSVGGTFTVSPATGHYARTQDGVAGDTYKHVSPQGGAASPDRNGRGWWYGSGSAERGRETRAVIPSGPVEIGGTEVPRAF
jgi:plastocyanin